GGRCQLPKRHLEAARPSAGRAEPDLDSLGSGAFGDDGEGERLQALQHVLHRAERLASWPDDAETDFQMPVLEAEVRRRTGCGPDLQPIHLTRADRVVDEVPGSNRMRNGSGPVDERAGEGAGPDPDRSSSPPPTSAGH